MKILWCLVHVWNHWSFGYVAGQYIQGSCANDETSNASNIKRVVFCFHRFTDNNSEND